MISVLDNMRFMLLNLSNNVVFNNINRVLSQDLIFTLVFMIQMIFGGLGVVLVPERINNLANSPVTRVLLLTLIGFVATQNLGLALVGAVVFALVLFLLRNDEERDAAPLL